MTRTLTITSDEWASVHDGHLWIVRKGGRPAVVLGCASPAEDGVHSVSYSDGVGPCEWCGAPVPPPADLLAAAAPCETCRGDGIDRSFYFGEDRPCPDCRITLVGECPHDCKRFYGKVPGYLRGSNWAWVPCWCDGTGTVTLGYAYPASEVLRILAPGQDPSPGVDKWVTHICEYSDRGLCLWEYNGGTGNGPGWKVSAALPLAHYGDPAGLVGKWALELREVES